MNCQIRKHKILIEGQLPNSKLGSPGLDDFTVEFFKFFWVDVGQFILRSLNDGYRNGSLSITKKTKSYHLYPQTK